MLESLSLYTYTNKLGPFTELLISFNNEDKKTDKTACLVLPIDIDRTVFYQ